MYLFMVSCVALRKESVDRNLQVHLLFIARMVVALRKESVDRNLHRRLRAIQYPNVALRKESVDRNTQRRDFKRLGLRRSPQGERG